MARGVRILAELHSRRRFRRRLFLCGGRSDYSASFCPSAGLGLGCSIIDCRRVPPTRAKFPASGCGHADWSLLKALAGMVDDVVDFVDPDSSAQAVSDRPSPAFQATARALRSRPQSCKRIRCRRWLERQRRSCCANSGRCSSGDCLSRLAKAGCLVMTLFARMRGKQIEANFVR
jgi:hypothetical protein